MAKQQQITPNVYVEDRFNLDRGCTPSFVTTSEGVVMIDSPMFPTDAVKWRDLIKKAEKYVISSTPTIISTILWGITFSRVQ